MGLSGPTIYHKESPLDSAVKLGDFLQFGTKKIAAGYVIYGSSTVFVFSTGQGVYGFTFELATGEYFYSHPNMRFSEKHTMYSINDSLCAQLDKPNQALLDYCRNRENGLTARYTGSLVLTSHRNLLKGGLYIYPAYDKTPNGKLPLQYECNPLAFLAEQAEGSASNGKQNILCITPKDIHQRCPFFIGPKAMVKQAIGSGLGANLV